MTPTERLIGVRLRMSPTSRSLGARNIRPSRLAGQYCWMGVDSEDVASLTLRAYETSADQYAARTSTAPSGMVHDLLALAAPRAHVLELGSGPGRDAAALESAGVRVDRTDGASAFVDRLASAGHAARVLNVYDSDFGGPYDAVFANAVLLHVQRERLAGVLEVARRATIHGGVLVASFKKGKGEEWSTRKLDMPRHFTYWQEPGLQAVVRASGWTPLAILETTPPTSSERWITVTARNKAHVR